MFSVTQRVENIAQPRNGYLPSKSLSVYSYMDGKEIDFTTPIYSAFAAVQGMAVDYLTRFMSGERAEDAFSISMMGAAMMSDEAQAFDLLKRIKGIDRSSVDAACKLVQYDVVVRRGSQFYAPMNASPDNTILTHNRDFAASLPPCRRAGCALGEMLPQKQATDTAPAFRPCANATIYRKTLLGA